MQRRRKARPLTVAIALATLWLVTMASSASAKTPYFTVEVEPAVPVAGEPFLVVVQTWDDADHSTAARFVAAEALGGLLVARRRAGSSADVPIPLVFRGPDRFEARVTLPEGDWMLIAFPDRTSWSSPEVPPGYPDSVRFAVRDPTLDRTRVAATSGIVAALVVAIAALWHGRRIGRSNLRGRVRGDQAKAPAERRPTPVVNRCPVPLVGRRRSRGGGRARG